ncbi:MAG: alpha-2-macroglobulin [Magnetococcales bacterium]|nr:alpha-2-macroglobulin [Magnetococcales bacterium]
MGSVVFAAFVFFVSFSVAVAAPSFDCGRAKLPVELLICQDENLSCRDGEMGDAFSRAKKNLGQDRLETFKKKQLQWLDERLRHCHISNKKGENPADPKAAVACLMEVYRQRIQELAQSPTSISPGVEWASPRGSVKKVRQVTVRFTHPMVPLGDPRLEDPFIVQCPWKGQGRWADGRNWIYDFASDLPAGIICAFYPKETLKTLDGQPLGPEGKFSFSTGGPAIVNSLPPEGNEQIDEDQVFLLGLDAAADPVSIAAKVHCQVAGVAEKIGVRLLSPEERKPLIEANNDLVDFYLNRMSATGEDHLVFDSGCSTSGETDHGCFIQWMESPNAPVAAVQCNRHLPSESEVSLVWDQGVTSTSGVATGTGQTISFKVRKPFHARFSCDRVNADANCLPIRSLWLKFSAPIARNLAEKIVLKGMGEVRHPRFNSEEAQAEFVEEMSFPQPFPEMGEFTLELPKGLKDDAGRSLANQEEFPLKIKIDEFPPLAKFSANFGLIEAKTEPALPVTLRNLEAVLGEDPQSSHPKTGNDPTPVSEVRGHIFKVINPADFPAWLQRINAVQREKNHWDQKTGTSIIDQRIGESSVFTAAERPSLTTFKLAKPLGAKEFEVMGIPLPNPGFYVVELASQRLGLALHGAAKPYHVQTAALVTNMAAHFFHGRESSLVWVTALDSGLPVPEAQVTVADCTGKMFAQGTTDKEGLLRIKQELPPSFKLPECPGGERAFSIAARLGEDVTFVMSSWSQGIERWNFNLPGPHAEKPYLAHTVLDRSLLRGGETVHMKHWIRKHDRQGFSLLEKKSLPKKVTLRHAGGEAEYSLPLTWDDMGTAENRFEIPKEAKLGTYEISMDRFSTGSFRVETFRVPLMKGMVKPVQSDLVNASQAELDLQVHYLAGGAASHAPVKVRGMLSPKTVSFPDYEGFQWANGDVRESRTELGRPRYDAGENSPKAGTGERSLAVVETNLDRAGGGRVVLQGWGAIQSPKSLLAEMEYRDPNGEVLTSAARLTLWPAAVVVGIKMDNWMQGRESVRFQVATLDTSGKPQVGVPVAVDVFVRKTFSHRKRLLGGFYSYDQYDDIEKIQEFCSGKSDERGRLFCEGVPPAAGQLILRAKVADAAGHASFAHAEVWVPEEKDTWFAAREGDRMDLLPEKQRYEPGEKARLQVRMPFREATGLVVVEREGVMEASVQPLSGQAPLVSVPILGNYGPNVFIAVMAVRGRSGEVQPTALVDMGRPAMRLGMTRLQVGWRDYGLNVGVTTDRTIYKTRETAEVSVVVNSPNGNPVPLGGEIALAAVDEGLLELLPNDSWKLLEGMMAERGLEVGTATAMGQVIGRRHFGKKAVPQGGGGGRGSARELFDTLLLWEGRVKLDEKGMARVKVPLNDAITSFRIVAIASAGTGLFGTGATTIRTSRDVVLFSGLPPMVREGDRFQAGFTVRNAGEKPVQGQVRAKITPEGVGELENQAITLAPGEAQEVFWDVSVPKTEKLSWDVAVTAGEASEQVKVTQEVKPAIPVRILQASLSQMDKETQMDIAMPAAALPGRGGVGISLAPSLSGHLTGVREYMQSYPYTCMEQRLSKAVVLGDESLRGKVLASLPSHLDKDGLLKYFPSMSQGSDTLTSYLLTLAATAHWKIPEKSLEAMKKGLLAFVAGKILRDSGLLTADLAVRKVAALAALARYDTLDPQLAGSIAVEPNLWPTSAVLDWIDLLNHAANWPDRDLRKQAALHILRARLNFAGSTMGFSTEQSDRWWWLMVSADVNANRAILILLGEKDWQEDMGRMMRGSLARRQRGHWDTSVANAWGTLAVQRFAEAFEGEAVSGTTLSQLAGDKQILDWSSQLEGGRLEHPWPQVPSKLRLEHLGGGKPWLTVETRGAIPLSEPFFAGYRVQRSVTAVEQKQEGEWHRGDLYRVRLELEAQGDMTWVVVEDPVPGGSTLLGSGLGKDSQIMTTGEKNQGMAWPAFTERSFDFFRAYYEWVPKGKWQVEYTVRLNTSGDFQLPPTRVEAMYAPEMYAESPNIVFTVLP